MLDWLASVAVVRRTERRIELAITATTRWTGWAVALGSIGLIALIWPLMPMLAAVPALIAAVGVLLATTSRRMVFDRDDGLLRVEQRILGVRSRLAVPLFHLRSVVIASEASHFVVSLERRAGGRIRVDDSRHLAHVVALGREICDVTGLRLVTEAPRTSSAG